MKPTGILAPHLFTEMRIYSHYAWVSTGYFRGEWEPSVSWYALDNANVQIWTPGLTYYYSDSWKICAEGQFLYRL